MTTHAELCKEAGLLLPVVNRIYMEKLWNGTQLFTLNDTKLRFQVNDCDLQYDTPDRIDWWTTTSPPPITAYHRRTGTIKLEIPFDIY